MGNCLLRRSCCGEDSMVKVVTANGGVMELRPPVTAECVTNGFPGHGVFTGPRARSGPLVHNEELLPGETYYLRPINGGTGGTAASIVASYKVSFNQPGLAKKQELEPSSSGRGVWKVKLVITPAQLAEILSQETRTEALIESVRTVAKCGYGAASSAANSDQWSFSSSRKCPSDHAT
ncbi:uncharacterized protein LOC144716974 [Wolffia australiana]